MKMVLTIGIITLCFFIKGNLDSLAEINESDKSYKHKLLELVLFWSINAICFYLIYLVATKALENGAGNLIC